MEATEAADKTEKAATAGIEERTPEAMRPNHGAFDTQTGAINTS